MAHRRCLNTRQHASSAKPSAKTGKNAMKKTISSYITINAQILLFKSVGNFGLMGFGPRGDNKSRRVRPSAKNIKHEPHLLRQTFILFLHVARNGLLVLHLPLQTLDLFLALGIDVARICLNTSRCDLWGFNARHLPLAKEMSNGYGAKQQGYADGDCGNDGQAVVRLHAVGTTRQKKNQANARPNASSDAKMETAHGPTFDNHVKQGAPLCGWYSTKHVRTSC